MNWTDVVLALLIVCLIVQAFYYVHFYATLPSSAGTSSNSEQGVSILICAKNEASNLAKNLPAVLSQDYPRFEVIVADDRSDDNTGEVLKAMSSNEPTLKVVDVAESDLPGKRNALLAGASQAAYDRLLLTDADCLPASDSWVKEMMGAAGNNGSIVLGYAPLERKSGALNAWARFDTFFTGMQYLTMAGRGRAYMGVGRNLSYPKGLLDTNAFVRDGLLSGDDDLLVNQAASSSQVVTCVSPKAFCTSQVSTGWSEWIRRKVRHLSTGLHYSLRSKLLLGGFHASQVGFYVGILALILAGWWMFGILFYAVRMVFVWVILGLNLRRLEERGLAPFIPGLDFAHTLYLALFTPALFSKPKQWT